MIKVKELRKVLDECDAFNFSNYAIKPVDELEAMEEAVVLKSDSGCNIEIWDFMLDKQAEKVGTYIRFTAPKAKAIDDYLISRLDEWWEEE